MKISRVGHAVQITSKKITSKKITSKPIPLKGEIKLEIERKFLVKHLPRNYRQYPHKYMEQGYLFTKEGTSFRLRETAHKDDDMTIKLGTGSTKPELAYEFPKVFYKALWNETKGARLKKTRYEIPYDKWTIELDIYHGRLEGFYTAEVEFDSEEEADEFILPEWFGREVTGIKGFTNRNLATKGVPRKLLRKLARS